MALGQPLGAASTAWERAGEQQGLGPGSQGAKKIVHGAKETRSSASVHAPGAFGELSWEIRELGDSQSLSLRIWEAQEAAMCRG